MSQTLPCGAELLFITPRGGTLKTLDEPTLNFAREQYAAADEWTVSMDYNNRTCRYKLVAYDLLPGDDWRQLCRFNNTCVDTATPVEECVALPLD